MSETPRTYTKKGGPISLQAPARRDRGPTLRLIAIALFILLIIGLWTTRDSHPIHEFVAADRTAHIVFADIMRDRVRIGNSRLWSGMPNALLPPDMPGRLGESFGLPDWVLRNLAGGPSIMTVDDLDELSDRVFIARMTRVGCLLQRLNALAPGISGEWAGGLSLRKLDRLDLFYTVRGRTLLVSPDRDQLVHVLTLLPDERLDRDAVKKMLAAEGPEDISGVIHPGPDSQLGRVLESVRFVARVDVRQVRTKLQLIFQPEWRARIARDLAGASRPLDPPVPAPLSLSADFGAEIETLVALLDEMTALPWLSHEQWEDWENATDSPTARHVFASLTAPMGPQFRLAWYGFDMNATAPLPLLLADIAGDRAASEEYLNALRTGPTGPAYTLASARFDTDTGQLTAPLRDDPSANLIAEWNGDRLQFATSAETMSVASTVNSSESTTADLVVQMDPLGCVNRLVEAGHELVAGGLLKGYTPEDFKKESAMWLEKAAAIRLVTGELTLGEGLAEIDILVECAN